MKEYFKIEKLSMNQNRTQSDWVEERDEEFKTLEAARAASAEYGWAGHYDGTLGCRENSWSYRGRRQHLLAVDSGRDSSTADATPVRIVKRWSTKP